MTFTRSPGTRRIDSGHRSTGPVGRVQLIGLLLLVFVVWIGEAVPWALVSTMDGWPELATATLVTSGYLSEARAATETERDLVRAERDAFDRFENVVEATPVSNGTRSTPLALDGDGRSQRLRSVRDAYRDTVLSVPHYEDEYGESLRESLAFELDDRIATALVDGRDFYPALKWLVMGRVAEAKRSRDRLLDGLETELTSLENAGDCLRKDEGSIERAMESSRALRRRSESVLREYETTLRRAESRCERILADRQDEIHRGNRAYSRSSEPILQQYLYADLEVTFPVLAAVAERIERLRTQRQAIRDEIPPL